MEKNFGVGASHAMLVKSPTPANNWFGRTSSPDADGWVSAGEKCWPAKSGAAQLLLPESLVQSMGCIPVCSRDRIQPLKHGNQQLTTTTTTHCHPPRHYHLLSLTSML